MAACEQCGQALTVELDSDSFDEATSSSVGRPQTAPDDLQLACGCHFHWQCLLDESPQVALDLACPNCQNSIVSTSGPSATNRVLPQGNPEPRIIVRYHNEGGMQTNLDILPLITEEAYLEANPGKRPARAFMVMCAEGDVAGIVELLKNVSSEDEEMDDGDEDDERDEGSLTPREIVRWQDPLDGGKTGLHVALGKGHEEVVWLLLWLGSGLEASVFPEEVIEAAKKMEAERSLGGAGEGEDVRRLRDAAERTPSDVARSMGDSWAGLVTSGVLG